MPLSLDFHTLLCAYSSGEATPAAIVREESRRPGSGWPAQSGVRPVRQENKLLIPASFSPVR